MKQISNIEETHNTREVEKVESALADLSFWNELDTDGQCELRDAIYHQLQKAREEERERILTFIRSGHPEPWKDTGWSIELNDIEDFILHPTKTDKQ